MKSIEERALDKFPVVLISEEIPEDYFKSHRQAFIDGAKSEHKELTKWNSPNIIPEKDKWILMKLTRNNFITYFLSKYYSDMFKDIQSCGYTLLGWREIHE